MKRIVENKLVDYAKEPMENMPKELLPPVYIRNGAIYAVKRNILVNRRSFKGSDCRPYVMPKERSINIDDEIDFLLAETLMKEMKWDHIKPIKSGG
jgi:CMP-N-acetylneuraminic acid synthetase